MEDFINYVNKDMDKIGGWADPKRAVLFLEELEKMRRHFGGKDRGIMEIGVWHGKFLIALYKLVGGHKSLGIDLFANPESREKCLENIRRFCSNPDNIVLLTKNSLDIDGRFVDYVQREFGRFSYISIDGGHQANHLVNDLNFAIQVADNSGFIILDDYFSPLYPGVSEGFYSWIKGFPKFVPLLLIKQKLYLSHFSFAKKYYDYLRKNTPAENYREVRHFGYECLAYKF